MGAHVGTGVYNADRISRIPGTYNRKGENTPERPHQLATIVSVPVGFGDEVATEEQLRKIVAEADGRDKDYDVQQDELADADLDTLKREVSDYVNEYCTAKIERVRETDDRIFLDLSNCPFRGPEHTDGNPAILLHRDGSVGLKSFHQKCDGKGWSDLQALSGEPFTSSVASYQTDHWNDLTLRR